MKKEIAYEDIVDPWKSVSNGERVFVGSVGVDGGSLEIGEPRSGNDTIHCHTYTGDGRYPVFAQVVKGKRCLVIDLEARVTGKEIRNEYPSRCPACFELIDPHSHLASEDWFEYTCECGKTFEVHGDKITDFKDMSK